MDESTASGPVPSAFPPGLIPVVVGATGHRDIPPADLARLRSAISGTLAKFEAQCGASPLVLLTGLAAGADQLVAQCVLDRNKALKRWSIGAVLALPAEEFANDFDPGPARAGFEALLSQCDWITVAAPSGTVKPLCYVAVGDVIARQAQWLIALWDGKPSDKQGGTADVVRRFITGIPLDPNSEGATPLRLSSAALPEVGPVIQLRTRRSSSVDEPGDAGVASIVEVAPRNPVLTSDEDAHTAWARMEWARWGLVLRRIDEFNHIARELIETRRPEVERLRGYLQSGGPPDIATEIQLPPASVSASWVYAVADLLSLDAQKRRNRIFRYMIAVSVLSVAFEQAYSSNLTAWTDWLFLCMAFVLGIAACFPLIRAGMPGEAGSLLKDADARYRDCRSLAEACRVQFYWKLAGLRECAADYHLLDQRDELEWIRQGVRATEIYASPASQPPPTSSAHVQAVKSWWIDDQRNYFGGPWNSEGSSEHPKKGWRARAVSWLRTGRDLLPFAWAKRYSRKEGAAIREHRRHRFFTTMAWGLFGCASLGIYCGITVGATGLAAQWPAASPWIQFCYGVTLACAAAARVWSETQAYREHSISYERMAVTMAMASRRVSELTHMTAPNRSDPMPAVTTTGATRIFFEVGRAALDENSDWLLLHRERPPGPPITK